MNVHSKQFLSKIYSNATNDGQINKMLNLYKELLHYKSDGISVYVLQYLLALKILSCERCQSQNTTYHLIL